MSTTENAKRFGTTAKTTKQSNTAAAGSPKPEVASLDRPAHLEAPAPTLASSAGPGQPQAPKRKATYEERMRRLPPIVQVRRKLQSTITRFANLAVEGRAWRNAPDLSEAATRVEASLISRNARRGDDHVRRLSARQGACCRAPTPCRGAGGPS